MTGIWTNLGEGLGVGTPQAFPDERTLHGLIEENPQLLPLAGSPRLTVLGSEVRLGNGYADILAVETSGRPAIIEVKLASNSEARKAIVSQVIAYAAFLRGFDVEGLEQGPLRKPLADAECGSILEAVQAQDQEGTVDADSFTTALKAHLDQGNFRLVLVLDEVSAELERVVAYLDAVTIQALTIDLITLTVYEVNGAQVALPQRVSPDLGATMPVAAGGSRSDGSGVFRASVEGITGEPGETFERLITWADQLASLPSVRLVTTEGTTRYTLAPKLKSDDAGLVTIWNENQKPSLTVHWPVFERRAPQSVESVKRIIAPTKIGRWNAVWDITPQLLEALTAAYQEADKNCSTN